MKLCKMNLLIVERQIQRVNGPRSYCTKNFAVMFRRFRIKSLLKNKDETCKAQTQLNLE